ncbi:putative plant disease resistance response protein [Medicago truncatula]|uniref:Dirigent protein n=1 Tax=Medicago truncatula TaxID=3880 RepID=G7JKK5_MEDTR|nr:dirigent protein 22 [Medicago truncatula]AFK46865.1 unknown [Medicago truncatula]KEH15925.1 disease resistance response protein [Medicago truncatula]KEH28836.1 disease resistance response protein [Medicago truncatula]RHN58694.1 putative plant disease resistance response protein [Medicago truncatula]
MAIGAFKIIFFLLLSCYTLTIVTAQDETGFVGSIDPKLFRRRQNVSHFRFYWHDVVSGDNATAIEIIPPLPKFNTTNFGEVKVIDNALTSGPQLSSKLVGRAQGIYSYTSQTELNFLMIMNFALFEGKYNGSTITILGRNDAYEKVREMPVIGGSGLFRFAKGYAELTTYFLNTTTGDATSEYNIYVSHYV